MPSGFVNETNQAANTISIAEGGSCGYVNFIKTEFWLGACAFSIIPKNEFILQNQYEFKVFNKFIFYFLKMNQKKIEGFKRGAVIQHLPKAKLSSFLIPIVPAKTQEKIVQILDKFDELTKGLSSGLPKEIDQRQKQYEYYRRKLLDFNFETVGGGA